MSHNSTMSVNDQGIHLEERNNPSKPPSLRPMSPQGISMQSTQDTANIFGDSSATTSAQGLLKEASVPTQYTDASNPVVDGSKLFGDNRIKPPSVTVTIPEFPSATSPYVESPPTETTQSKQLQATLDVTTVEDPWDEFNKINRKTDKSMCEGWRDEIDKLLVFAGLFSGVVTAFTIESYQWLQQDPTDSITVLLEQIGQRLSNPQVNPQNFNTTVSSLTKSFRPDAWAVRVNILWFLSLSLSLTTALVGILCIQWFREYQRYPNTNLPPKDTFAIRQMRFEGLEKWRVPEIMAALPLLLQSSLVLFFVGLLDLLWNIHPAVAVIISISIGLTLLFLIITTALPIFQCFFFAALLKLVPQCPYKSPQSWMVCRIGTIITHAAPSRDRYRFQNGVLTDFLHDFSLRGFLYRMRKAIQASDWIQYDKFWREIRSDTPSRRGKCHIDNENGIRALAKGLLPTDERGCFRVSRCVEDLAGHPSDLEGDSTDPKMIHGYDDHCPWDQVLSSAQLKTKLGRDMIRFLSMLHPPPTLDQTKVLDYKRELFIQIFDSISADRLRDSDDNVTHRDGKEVFIQLLKIHVFYPFSSNDDVPIDILIQGFKAIVSKIDESRPRHIPRLVQLFFTCLIRATFRSKHQPTEVQRIELHKWMSYACEMTLKWVKDSSHSEPLRFWARWFIQLNGKLDKFKDHPLYAICKPLHEEAEHIYLQSYSSPASFD